MCTCPRVLPTVYLQGMLRSLVVAIVTTSVVGLAAGSLAVSAGLGSMRTSTARAATGTLRYRILGPDGGPVPARLTVLSPSVDLVELGEAFTDRYAVRENVCYTLDGAGLLRLPAGEVEIVASRGLEWSIDRRTIAVPAGGEVRVDFEIAPAVDTTGLIGGDFHLHTLTHSGHGDSNMPERIVSLIGEGVELAIATDHNRNIDYRPTMDALAAGDMLTSVVGNEVSTPVGHFNAFPLDADRPPVPSRIPAAPPLFRLIRAEPNPLGLDPIIQVNHPRWNGIDYFSQADLDETTGTSDSPRWSPDFDAIEVLNENSLWGWFEPEDSPPLSTDDNTHSAMLDWYALLDTGHRAIATGNSDSHSVKANYAGVPRNYVASSTDDPAAIDPAETINAIRRGEVVVSSGPIVRASVRDAGPTAGLHDDPRMAVARDGVVTLDLEVQAAPWIDCDRIRIVRDGVVVAERAVAESTDRVRFEGEIEVPIEHDSWIVVLVDGNRELAPVVTGKKRPVLPVAIVNPFRIDADGDGAWTPPMDRVADTLTRMTSDEIDDIWNAADPAERRRLVAATRRFESNTRPGGPLPAPVDPAVRRELVRRGLAETGPASRLVRIAACRAVGDDPVCAEALQAMLATPDASPRTVGAAVQALARVDADGLAEHLPSLMDRHGPGLLRDLGTVALDEIAGPRPDAWLVAGPFPNADDLAALAAQVAADTDAAGSWEIKRARPNGLLSFTELATDPAETANATAVATAWITAPQDMTVPVLFGSDDGAVVMINGEPVHVDRTTHGASPFANLLQIPLRAGVNRVIVAVENAGGDFGFHFRPVHTQVTVTTDEPSGSR